MFYALSTKKKGWDGIQPVPVDPLRQFAFEEIGRYVCVYVCVCVCVCVCV
jgi:hypothetical protein